MIGEWDIAIYFLGWLSSVGISISTFIDGLP